MQGARGVAANGGGEGWAQRGTGERDRQSSRGRMTSPIVDRDARCCALLPRESRQAGRAQAGHRQCTDTGLGGALATASAEACRPAPYSRRLDQNSPFQSRDKMLPELRNHGVNGARDSLPVYVDRQRHRKLDMSTEPSLCKCPQLL